MIRVGFFSSDCEGCEHPLLSMAATDPINTWMNNAVAITPNGSLLKGSYDGYGRLNDRDADLGTATVWHEACWRRAGSPTEYRGVSKPSRDQGWFFGDGDHDMAEPGR